jgi:hypothetical protein
VQLASHALTIGGALEGGVVQQKNHTVGTELGIALEHAVTVLGTQSKGRQRVFWGEFSSPTVGDPAGVRPKRGF